MSAINLFFILDIPFQLFLQTLKNVSPLGLTKNLKVKVKKVFYKEV